MKTLKAIRVKDGYVVTLTDIRAIHNESDLLQFIRQQGLKLKKQFCRQDGKKNIIEFYAD